VRRFARASLEGWRYAHQHGEEIADRISGTLPRHLYPVEDFRGYNRTFAGMLSDYTLYPGIELGTIDRSRWQRAYNQMAQAGLIATPFTLDQLFADTEETAATGPQRSVPIAPAGVALAMLLAIVIGWRRLGFPFSSVLLTALVGVVSIALETELRHAQQQRSQLAVTEQLGSIRARLESVVNLGLSLTNGLAAFIAIDPDLDHARFDAYARAVLEREPALLNLAAAPDLVVRYVYPREGNEAAIGLDYRKVPAQRDAAERVLLTGELVVAGPVSLVQGGEAIIGRAPVYVDSPSGRRHAWGVVSAPIRLANLLERAGIGADGNALGIAIRGRDGRGAQGDVFFGDGAVFDAPDAVTMPVIVGGGSWLIAAVPKPTAGERLERWILRAFALGVLALALTVMRVRAAQRQRELLYSRSMERQAKEDALTGLPNRAAFREQLAATLARSTRSGARHALLFIDLDDFKSVNDNLGHDAGDRLLVEVAARVRACLRSTDTVARLSGDEFTVILYDISNEDASAHVAGSIVDSLARAFRIDGTEVFCGASVGVAIYPDDASDPETLIIKADQAMYSVKQAGRNGWHFYTREMHERSERRHRLYNDLAAALDAAQVQAWMQPVVAVESGRIVGCEALARWQRADGTWVPPAEFVEVAEERGLVNRLDLHMMRRGAEQVREINATLGAGLGLSVNISPRLFVARNQELERWMEDAQGIARDIRLTVEITERLLVGESDIAHRALSALSAAQIGIALDDFGTGFSSLGYLMRFPVDTIKIDRSFVRGIGVDPTSEALVETILAMGARLGKKVTAEGVETAGQLAYLRAHGCDFAQGYLLGKPMSPADFLTFVRENHRAG
jgi:diguanylate cyclase (GGDEF)-like protein